MKELLEAGVHFGHQTRRWNPKMKPYIFGKRNGIYIIDLQKTLKLFEEAAEFVAGLAAEGKRHPVRRHQAPGAGGDRRRGAPLRRVLRDQPLARRHADQLRHRPQLDRAPQGDRGAPRRREAARSPRRSGCGSSASATRWSKNLDGIRDMEELPDALFVVDPKKEYIAVDEANKLGIPVIAHRRHQLRSGADRLHHPGQRRRDPRHPAVRLADRRRLPRRRGASSSRRR